MNLQQLKCIVETARVGSITKAAEALYMNQPNLSRTIIDFENEYDITLFIRNSHGVTLTDAGRRVVEDAEQIINKTNNLENLLFNNDKEKINFKISIPRASYISSAFCDTVGKTETGKDFNIVFKETNNSEIINDVTINGYNLGIIRIPIETCEKFKKTLASKQVSYKEIWKFKYNVVFSKKHPLALRRSIRLDDLSGYSVLIHDDEFVPFISKDEMQKHILSFDSKSRILIKERGSQFDILSSLANTYMWVTPIPKFLLEKHGLVMKKCEDNEQVFVDLLIYPSNHILSVFEKDFVKNLLSVRDELRM